MPAKLGKTAHRGLIRATREEIMSSTSALVRAITVLESLNKNRQGNYELTPQQMIHLQRCMLSASTSLYRAIAATHETDDLIHDAR